MPDQIQSWILPLALLGAVLPFVSFLWLYLLGSRAEKSAHWPGLLTVSVALLLFTPVALQTWTADLLAEWQWQWLLSGPAWTFTLRVDRISALLLWIVAFISALVHLFSVAYMAHEEGRNRYYAALSFFTFSMMGLLLAGHLLLLYVFWELVGLSSYLLIGFNRQRPEAVAAARKAFLYNRLGDTGLLAGILLLLFKGGTADWADLVPGTEWWHYAAAIGLLAGAAAKSAQLPFSAWLPDAMEGPTPASALIHAATMVAAGVYLLIRTAHLFPPEVLLLTASIGVLTALAAALAALAQPDLKKVLAYSTISQLGFMFAAAGSLAPAEALFHLVTHAFFKAGLFLMAGLLIHQMHEYLHDDKPHADPRQLSFYGGAARLSKWQEGLLAMLCLSLAGLPLFSGFLSKEAILAAVLAGPNGVGELFTALLLLVSLLTAIYTGRLFFSISTWRSRVDVPEAFRWEGQSVAFRLPVAVLAIASIGVWFAGNPLSPAASWLMPELLAAAPVWLPAVAVALAIGGLAFAWNRFGSNTSWAHELMYPTKRRVRLTRAFFHLELPGTKTALALADRLATFDHRWVDGAVRALGVMTVVMGHLSAWADRTLVDGSVRLIAWFARAAGRQVRTLQSGNVQGYTLTSFLFLMILIALVWWAGS